MTLGKHNSFIKPHHNFIIFFNSDTLVTAELEPRDREMTFETLHQEIGKPIQENLNRPEATLAVV